MKSGFVSIVGRPNVGKSTLLNKLLNQKIAITSDKVGTTRNMIYGVYNEDDTQIVFVDTPGINKATSKLGEVLNKTAYSSFDNDLVLFLVDIASGFGPNDNKILNRLKEDNKDVILVLTKVDKIKKDKLYDEITKLKDLYNFLDIVPISSIKGINTTELIEVIKKYLKDDVKYFDDDVITNVSEKFLVGEIIREKVLNLTREEVPHAVTCVVENMEFKKDKCYINACIVVDRDNLKGIIIGKNGQMLKKIGSMAREEIEVLLGKKVYLELFVKVIDNWRQKPNLFQELGISEEDD
ncbi:MAG: GTPase Era [Tenericutes bacterium]|nr:GTPase Era [Mycoplasmatota bacterium]